MAYKIIRRFVPLAFLATALCGLVYLAAQQSLRQGANDPQIQMAEDAAAALSGDRQNSPTDFLNDENMNAIAPPGVQVDIKNSLSPYTVIYNQTGDPIQGTAFYPNCDGNSTLPCLPQGVFSKALSSGEDRITWQPETGVRQAIVIVPVISKIPSGEGYYGFTGFVMVGRSLREVEIREKQVAFEAGMIWIFTIVGLLILEIIFALIESRWTKR